MKESLLERLQNDLRYKSTDRGDIFVNKEDLLEAIAAIELIDSALEKTWEVELIADMPHEDHCETKMSRDHECTCKAEELNARVTQAFSELRDLLDP